MEAHSDIICSRQLSMIEADGKATTVAVRLARPRILDETWVCDFDITGPNGLITLIDADGNAMSHDGTQYAYGSDEFDAIYNALAGIRVAVDNYGQRVSWMNEPGFHGFYKLVMGSSLRMQRYLENMVDDEVSHIRSQLADETTRAAVLARLRDP